MKYKPLDKVRIKSLDWYNENKNENGNVRSIIGEPFIEEMSKYCGLTTVIKIIVDGAYKIDVDNGKWCWTDEMIEGLMEDKVFIKANDIYNEEYSKGEYCHEQSFKWGFQEGYNYSHENDKLEISLKEGYIFKDENGNVINATKIVLEKKKKEYPKTYEECCNVLEYIPLADDVIGYKWDVLQSLQTLLICRDAYWKIAGEEMGLGKPWEPDWQSGNKKKYCVYNDMGNICKGDWFYPNAIFAFPTPEMRDAFKENFKSEIEICKELL